MRKRRWIQALCLLSILFFYLDLILFAGKPETRAINLFASASDNARYYTRMCPARQHYLWSLLAVRLTHSVLQLPGYE